MSVYGHLLAESTVNESVSAEDIKEAIKKAVEKVKRWFKELIAKIQNILSKAKNLPSKFKNKLEALLEKIKDHFSKTDNINTYQEAEYITKMCNSDTKELESVIKEIQDDASIDSEYKSTLVGTAEAIKKGEEAINDIRDSISKTDEDIKRRRDFLEKHKAMHDQKKNK